MTCSRHPGGDGPSWCQDCHGRRPAGFDSEEGETRREESIQRVDEHADEEVKAALLEAALSVARTRERFTTDAVRYVYERAGTNPPIREARVLGPIMRRLQREGVVIPLNEWKLSVWAANHRRPVRVWQSRISQ